MKWIKVVAVSLLLAACLTTLIMMVFYFGVNVIIIPLELVAFTTIMLPLITYIAWQAGYLEKLFTKLETGNIKFIDAGRTNVKTYINIPGKILVDGVIVNGDSEKSKTYIQQKFGRYWVGFPFFGRNVHTFLITKERPARRLVQDMSPSDWIEYDDNPVSIDELRWRFPRPVLVPDVKFGDNIEANILVLCRFEVVAPIKPIYFQKGSFFETLANMVRSGMVNYCKGMRAVEFAVADRLDGGAMSCDIINAINKNIEEEVGVRLTGLSIPIYNESKSEEEEALEAAEIARLEGLATIAKEKADAEALIIKTKAENEKTIMDAKALAEADTILGQASVVDVLTTAEKFAGMGANPDIAVTSATALGRAKRLSIKDSPITTFVDGGSQNVSVPLPQRK